MIELVIRGVAAISQHLRGRLAQGAATEASLLVEIGTIKASSPRLPHLCDALQQILSQVAPSCRVYLWLTDALSGDFVLAAPAVDALAAERAHLSRESADSIASQITDRRAIISMKLPGIGPTAIIPLRNVRGSEAFGYLGIMMSHRPRILSNSLLWGVGQIFGAQLGQLTTQMQHSLRDLIEERAAVATSVKEFLYDLVKELSGTFDAAGGSIFLFDNNTQSLHLAAATTIAHTEDWKYQYALGEGVTGWVALRRRVMRLNHLQDRARLHSIDPELTWRARSWEVTDLHQGGAHFLGGPLLYRKEMTGGEVEAEGLLGLVRLSKAGDPVGFPPGSEDLLEHVLPYIARAVVGLARKENAEYIAAVAVDSQAETLDESLARILRLAIRSTGADDGYIALTSGGSRTLEIRAAEGLSEERRKAGREVGLGIVGRAIAERRILNPPTRKERERLSPRIKKSDAANSDLAVPILYHGHALGAVDLHAARRYFFTPTDVERMTVLARLIGGLVWRRREGSVGKEKLEGLAKIIHQAARTDDYWSILSFVVEEAARAFNASYVEILSLDQERLLVEASTPAAHGPGRSPPQTQKLGEGVIGYVARTGRVVALGNVERRPPDVPYLPIRSGTRSELCVPLFDQDRVVAVLNMESDIVGAYKEDDAETVWLAEAFAAQAGIVFISALSRKANEAARRRVELLQRQAVAGQLASRLRHQVVHVAQVAESVTDAVQRICEKLRKRDAESADEIIEQLQQVTEAISGLGALAERFRRIAEGQQQIGAGVVVVNSQVRDCVSLCKWSLGERQQIIGPKFDGDLDPVENGGRFVFRGAGGDLQHALLNLLLNASEFSHRKQRIDVETSRTWCELRRRFEAAIRVTDYGMGIAEEDKGRVFEEGFTKREGGTGLGLAIAREQIRSWGGDIEFSSKKDKGSTFTIRVPVEPVD